MVPSNIHITKTVVRHRPVHYLEITSQEQVIKYHQLCDSFKAMKGNSEFEMHLAATVLRLGNKDLLSRKVAVLVSSGAVK